MASIPEQRIAQRNKQINRLQKKRAHALRLGPHHQLHAGELLDLIHWMENRNREDQRLIMSDQELAQRIQISTVQTRSSNSTRSPDA